MDSSTIFLARLKARDELHIVASREHSAYEEYWNNASAAHKFLYLLSYNRLHSLSASSKVRQQPCL